MSRWRPLVLATGFCGLVVWGASAQTYSPKHRRSRECAWSIRSYACCALTVRELEADTRERSLLANPTVSYTREDAGLSVDDFLLVDAGTAAAGTGGSARRGGRARPWPPPRLAPTADLLAFDTRLRHVFTDLLLAQERLADTGRRECRS